MRSDYILYFLVVVLFLMCLYNKSCPTTNDKFEQYANQKCFNPLGDPCMLWCCTCPSWSSPEDQCWSCGWSGR